METIDNVIQKKYNKTMLGGYIKMANKVTTYRLSNKTLKQLEELSDIYQISTAQVITRLVDSEWVKSTEIGQKKLKAINENMQSMINQLSNLLTEGDQ